MLDKTFYGNTVTEWLIALGIIIGGVIASKIIYWVFKNVMRKLTEKTKTQLDDIIVDMVEEPLSLAIVVYGMWLGLGTLALSERLQFWIDKGIYLVVLITVAWFITRIFDALVQAYLVPLTEASDNDLDDQILPIIRKGIKMVVWVVAIIVGMDNAGYDVGAILAGLGIGGLAMAMAAKDMVANLFGSFTVFTDRPFTVGDRIAVGGVDGTVGEVGLRSTRLTTLAGRTVTIPNAKFQNSMIENISSEPTRKVSITLGLTYDMDDAKMQKGLDVLNDIASSNSSLDGGHKVGFSGFGDFSLNLLFIYYIKKGEDILGTQTAVNMEILKQFTAEGLDMAFPTQTLQHLPVEVVSGK